MIHVSVLSSQPALRAGLRALLSADPEIAILSVGSRLEDVLPLPAELDVLVATLDGMLDSMGEEEALPAGVSLLLVTADPADLNRLPALELRAWGAVSPDSAGEALQAAVRALAEGLVAFSPELAAQMGRSSREGLPRSLVGASTADDLLAADPLTPRETDVLRLLADGLTNKQIALGLQISEHTVKFHVSAIYAKLGVANRAEAVRKGARAGYLPI